MAIGATGTYVLLAGKVREKLSMDRAELRPCYKNHYSMVTIYDASSSFFVSKELAGKYVINITDIQAMCRYNANFAAAFDRSDLIQAWCLAAFGQNLIHSLIQHYAKQSDIQMAEMLSCAFSYRWENPDMSQSRIVSKSLNASILEEGGASDDYNENTSNFMEEVPIQYTDDISRQLVDVERTVAVE